MIYSESINSRIKYQRNSTLKNKIISAIFMITGLTSGVVATIVLLHRVKIL